MRPAAILFWAMWSACSADRGPKTPIARAEPPPSTTQTARLEATSRDTSESDTAERAAEVESPSPVTPASPPPAAPTEVSETLCREACQNALKVTLAELPEASAPSMREELTRSLEQECPTRCVAKASLESARCIATARSALALAACP